MCYVRYDGGINKDDVPINLPSQQLQDLATSYYETKVEVGPNQRKIMLNWAQHNIVFEQWSFGRLDDECI